MSAYEMFGVALLIFLGCGFLIGWLVSVVTGSRFAAIASGMVAGLLGVIAGFWLYYSFVLCPPGSGCA